MKNVTIKDVAKAAGVSYSTVSRALSDSPEISEETRGRILEICRMPSAPDTWPIQAPTRTGRRYSSIPPSTCSRSPPWRIRNMSPPPR